MTNIRYEPDPRLGKSKSHQASFQLAQVCRLSHCKSPRLPVPEESTHRHLCAVASLGGSLFHNRRTSSLLKVDRASSATSPCGFDGNTLGDSSQSSKRAPSPSSAAPVQPPHHLQLLPPKPPPIVGHLQPEVVGGQVSSHCNRGGSRLQAVQHQLLHALPGAGQRGTLLESNSSVRRYWTKVRSGSPVRITHSSYSAGILELYLLELLGEVFQLQEFKSSL